MAQHPTLLISFHGKTYEFELTPELTVNTILERLSCRYLLYQGKKLDNSVSLYDHLGKSIKKKSTTVRLLATGISQQEQEELQNLYKVLTKKNRVRDDLTEQGQAQWQERQRLGHYLLHQTREKGKQQNEEYKFHRIEILPHLPNQQQALDILTQLANDPGILACLTKHQWNVGCLAELYPQGNVGQSPVCIMGLNENKGQRILLRLRTDDLQGFRKMSSIRKVLYHELAHNVYSEHDNDFFQLMRQIERECHELDWTQGEGLTTSMATPPTTLYTGGTYRLGGGTTVPTTTTNNNNNTVSLRELAAQAAEARMTPEEQEIQDHCGGGVVGASRPAGRDTSDSS